MIKNDKFICPIFSDFLNNPVNTGNASLNINTLKQNYTLRYDILKKDGKEFKINVYKENDRSYYFHILVPSENKKNNYDVVIHFFNEFGDDTGNLKKYNVNFFSNCPSFIFTYAMTYNVYGMFIGFFANKYNKKVFDELPKDRNPDLILSYDKSIFHACYHLSKESRYLQRFFIDRIAKPFNKSGLFDIIRDEDQILQECEDFKEKQVIIVTPNKSNAVSKAVRDVKDKVVDNVAKSVGIPVIGSKRKDHYIIPRSKLTAKRKRK